MAAPRRPNGAGAAVTESGCFLWRRDPDATARSLQPLWANRGTAPALLETGGTGRACALAVGAPGVAAEVGLAPAAHLGVPLRFASPDVPDDDAPRRRTTQRFTERAVTGVR